MAKKLPIARMGEPILKRVANFVDLMELDKVRSLVEDMIYTLDDLGERVGLAAPQVFIPLQIVLFRIPVSAHARYQVDSDPIPLTCLINPQIILTSNDKIEGWEACISLPGLMGSVPRYQAISYTYYDLDGNFHQKNASGFHARVLQHECDHLKGILYPQQMNDLSTLGFEEEVLKYKKEPSTPRSCVLERSKGLSQGSR